MKITQTTLQKMVENREKIAVPTCYDATFAAILENAGVDVLLVGDSLGNVLRDSDTTAGCDAGRYDLLHAVCRMQCQQGIYHDRYAVR